MHLLLTGGTGFFGKALLRYWQAGGAGTFKRARITLLSRDPKRFLAAHADLIEGLDVKLVLGDIQKPATLPLGAYTHVLHAAAESTTGTTLTPLQRIDQIVDGTRNVLDLALRCGLPRVLLVSSGGVYGEIPRVSGGVVENYLGAPDPMEPENAYSIAKRYAEHLCTVYGALYGAESVIARCFTFLGEDLPVDAHFAIGNFISDALSGRDIIIRGDGMSVRSYMDQRDLARWLSTLMLFGAPQRAYNVGSPEPISILEVAQKVAALAPGRKPNVRIMNEPPKGQSALRHFYVPNINRARGELGLDVEISLDAAIMTMFSSKLDG